MTDAASKVVVDVWGGEGSQNWLARFVLPLAEALGVAEQELRAGYLVNLRRDLAWGDEQNFDIRGGVRS